MNDLVKFWAGQVQHEVSRHPNERDVFDPFELAEVGERLQTEME